MVKSRFQFVLAVAGLSFGLAAHVRPGGPTFDATRLGVLPPEHEVLAVKVLDNMDFETIGHCMGSPIEVECTLVSCDARNPPAVHNATSFLRPQ
jgi:hypothetical protein